MGAWSHEPFGNDTACDWAHELNESYGLAFLEQTLDQVIECAQPIEAYNAERAIAAVETLAHLMGRGTQTDSYTDVVNLWILRNKVAPGAQILAKANLTLGLVISETCRLRQEWQIGDGLGRWLKSIDALSEAIVE
jgi:Domain of unknown function (DUF4259)